MPISTMLTLNSLSLSLIFVKATKLQVDVRIVSRSHRPNSLHQFVLLHETPRHQLLHIHQILFSTRHEFAGRQIQRLRDFANDVVNLIRDESILPSRRHFDHMGTDGVGVILVPLPKLAFKPKSFSNLLNPCRIFPIKIALYRVFKNVWREIHHAMDRLTSHDQEFFIAGKLGNLPNQMLNLGPMHKPHQKERRSLHAKGCPRQKESSNEGVVLHRRPVSLHESTLQNSPVLVKSPTLQLPVLNSTKDHFQAILRFVFLEIVKVNGRLECAQPLSDETPKDNCRSRRDTLFSCSYHTTIWAEGQLS